MQIADIVSDRSNGSRVLRIVLQLGALTAVLPDTLSLCFELASRGTPAEGATLEIQQCPGRARCRHCSREFELWRPFGICECGKSELDWLSGDQLRIAEMELA